MTYTVRYTGTSGVTVKAYSGSGHSGLLGTFTNVQNNALLTVSGAGLSGGILGRFPGDAGERDLSWFDAGWLADLAADGGRLLFMDQGTGADPSYDVYVRSTDGSPPVRLGEGHALGLSPDGKIVVASAPDATLRLYPVEGGAPTTLPGLTAEDTPVRWSDDGRFLYVYRPGPPPVDVYRYEVATGKKEVWKTIGPPGADRAGMTLVANLQITPDGSYYAYTYHRDLTDLYLAEGLR